jgi:DNA-binding response OmpR family regulator
MGRSLLVVDDEPVVGSLLSAILNKHGYHVVVADCGQAAIALYRALSSEISLVLLDVKMPGMRGLEVLARLREINHTVRAILISASDSEVTVEQRREPGVLGVLPKPFRMESFLAAVEAALAVP